MISVTQVLSPWADFTMIPEGVLKHAAERGTQVHNAIAGFLRGSFQPRIDPEVEPYFDSFLQWRPMVKSIACVEKEFIDNDLGVVGHPDLICKLKGDEFLTVVDWKTPMMKNPLWSAQLAGYQHLAQANGIHVRRRLSVRLKKNGRFPIVNEYKDHGTALAAFLSALNATKYFGPVLPRTKEGERQNIMRMGVIF